MNTKKKKETGLGDGVFLFIIISSLGIAFGLTPLYPDGVNSYGGLPYFTLLFFFSLLCMINIKEIIDRSKDDEEVSN